MVEGGRLDGARLAHHAGPEDGTYDEALLDLELAAGAGHGAAEGEQVRGDEVDRTAQRAGAGLDVLPGRGRQRIERERGDGRQRRRIRRR
jgi:hypothetical protein